jgi:hypothetical protein
VFNLSPSSAKKKGKERERRNHNTTGRFISSGTSTSPEKAFEKVAQDY